MPNENENRVPKADGCIAFVLAFIYLYIYTCLWWRREFTLKFMCACIFMCKI
jgi:hypothetical protein